MRGASRVIVITFTSLLVQTREEGGRGGDASLGSSCRRLHEGEVRRKGRRGTSKLASLHCL